MELLKSHKLVNTISEDMLNRTYIKVGFDGRGVMTAKVSHTFLSEMLSSLVFWDGLTQPLSVYLKKTYSFKDEELIDAIIIVYETQLEKKIEEEKKKFWEETLV